MPDPDDDALRSFFDENTARFAENPRLSFSQVYFNTESRKDAASDAAAALAALNAGAKQEELLATASCSARK